MTFKLESQDTVAQRGSTVLIAGGVIGALAAMSCCILPVVLFGLGVSGAWIANFTQLAPYQPYFVAASIACLGAGYLLARRSTKVACEGEACARPLSNRIVRIVLVAAALLIIAALGFDYIAPYVLT